MKKKNYELGMVRKTMTIPLEWVNEIAVMAKDDPNGRGFSHAFRTWCEGKEKKSLRYLKEMERLNMENDTLREVIASRNAQSPPV